MTLGERKSRETKKSHLFPWGDNNKRTYWTRIYKGMAYTELMKVKQHREQNFVADEIHSKDGRTRVTHYAGPEKGPEPEETETHGKENFEVGRGRQRLRHRAALHRDFETSKALGLPREHIRRPRRPIDSSQAQFRPCFSLSLLLCCPVGRFLVAGFSEIFRARPRALSRIKGRENIYDTLRTRSDCVSSEFCRRVV